MAPIYFQPCTTDKAIDTLVEMIVSIHQTHPTIATALEACQNILLIERKTNQHRELSAREFLGCAEVLFDQGATFQYSNTTKSIHYTLLSGESNTRNLSNQLWDEKTTQTTTTVVEYPTYHYHLASRLGEPAQNLYLQAQQCIHPMGQFSYWNPDIHQSPSEHAADIEAEDQTNNGHAAAIKVENQTNIQNIHEKVAHIQNWVKSTVEPSTAEIVAAVQIAKQTTSLPKHWVESKTNTTNQTTATVAAVLIKKQLEWRIRTSAPTSDKYKNFNKPQSWAKQNRPNTPYPTRKSNTESVGRHPWAIKAKFPAGFRISDEKERPYAGPTLRKSPDPSALPIPKFYKEKVSQISATPSESAITDSFEDLIDLSSITSLSSGSPTSLMASSPTSTIWSDDSEDLDDLSPPTSISSISSISSGSPSGLYALSPTSSAMSYSTDCSTSSTTATNTSEQAATTTQATTVNSYTEQLDQLSKGIAGCFVCCLCYIGESTIWSESEKLAAVNSACSSENYLEAIINVVHSIATTHIKATKFDQTKTEVPNFATLTQIYSLKKSIDGLRADIPQEACSVERVLKDLELLVKIMTKGQMDITLQTEISAQ